MIQIEEWCQPKNLEESLEVAETLKVLEVIVAQDISET